MNLHINIAEFYLALKIDKHFKMSSLFLINGFYTNIYSPIKLEMTLTRVEKSN